MANSIGDIPFYSTSPIPLQTGLGYREQALKNQGQETLNQGYGLKNDYQTQLNREATRTNDEADRQAAKSADLRDAYAQSVTHQPIGPSPIPAPQPQPQSQSQPATLPQVIGRVNFGQNLPTLQNPLIQPKPTQPTQSAPIGSQGPIRPPQPTQVVPTLAEQTGLAPLIAAHPATNQTLDKGAVDRGEHSAFQTFTQPGPNGQSYQTTIDRNKLLSIYGSKHPEDVEPLKAQFTAMDAKQAKDQTDAEWQHHVGIASDMYGIKLLEDNPDLAAKAWDQAYQKHAQNGENMTGIPVRYPGKEIFDKMNDQMLSATDRASEAAKSAAEAERAIHDREAEKQADMRNRIGMGRLGVAQSELALKQREAGGEQSNLTGQAYRDTLSAPQQEWLRGVATQDIPINPRSKEGMAAMKAASQAYPGIDINGAAKFKQEMGKVNAGTSGGVAVGTVKSHEHLDSMIQADQYGSQMGGPGLIAQSINAIGNLGTQAGNYQKVWEAGHGALINEMSRSFKGGPPAESEIVRDMKGLKFSDSPARKNLVYKEYSDLLLGQSTGVESQRQSLLRDADPGTSIMPQRTYDVIKKLNGGKIPDGLMPPFDATPSNTGVGSLMSYPKAPPVNTGQNPRFPQAAWAQDQNGKGGWFINTGSALKRVE